MDGRLKEENEKKKEYLKSYQRAVKRAGHPGRNQKVKS